MRNGVDWSYYKKFEEIDKKYLPKTGQGETKATQIVTAVTKLVYKWYNDGDVFDNTHALQGWWNDLSSYANWLHKYTGADYILERIEDCVFESDYEELLKDLTDYLEREEYLAEMDEIEAVGDIYNCDGPFRFVENEEDEEDW